MRPLAWVGQQRRWLLGTAALVLALAIPAGQVSTVQAQTACRFVLGFATLGAQIGAGPVGECRENQRFATNGNAEQYTTRGMMVWRKADNRTTFTDGYRTWLYGADGLQQRLNTERYIWEIDPGGETTIDQPPVSPNGRASVGTFVPCASLGRSYSENGSFEQDAGRLFYGCASPTGPNITQTLNERATNALAIDSFDHSVADTLDPRSSLNRDPGTAPWFQILSSGPAGSRAFKRQITVPNERREIEIFTVQGRYIVGVVLTFLQRNDGLGDNTAVRATEILTLLLARVPG